MVTNSQWVTLLISLPGSLIITGCLGIPWPTACEWHCFILCLAVYQSCLILWPTVSEWHCFISLPDSLINHVSSHDHEQAVSDTALFLCQPISSITPHYPMTNREWVTLLLFLCQPVSSIISHPMANREWVTATSLINWHVSSQHDQLSMWVTLLYSFATRQSHQSCLIPWSTGCEWHCFISSLINCVSSHDQQGVSGTALFHRSEEHTSELQSP